MNLVKFFCLFLVKLLKLLWIYTENHSNWRLMGLSLLLGSARCRARFSLDSQLIIKNFYFLSIKKWFEWFRSWLKKWSFWFVLQFFEHVVYSVNFHLVLFFDVFHDIGLDVDAVYFFLDPVFVDTERPQFVQVHGKERVSKVRKALHDLLKVHF